MRVLGGENIDYMLRKNGYIQYYNVSSVTVVVSGLQELCHVERGRERGHGQQILEHAAPQRSVVIHRLAVVERVVHGDVSGGHSEKKASIRIIVFRSLSLSLWSLEVSCGGM